jgi:uncharacterized membrane protein
MRDARAPTVVVGVGLGGFVDGILFHQVLGWHHMLSATEGRALDDPGGSRSNLIADMVFHSATWFVAFTGFVMLVFAWRDGRLAGPPRKHVGLLMIGWGGFNLVEGVVAHHLLAVHHVRDDVSDPLWWDLGFLAVGGALVALGSMLVRRASRTTSAGSPPAQTLAAENTPTENTLARSDREGRSVRT